MSNIVYVGFSFSHHKGTHAGYDKIKNHVNYDYFFDLQTHFDHCFVKKNGFLSRIKRSVFYHVFGSVCFPFFAFKLFLFSFLRNDCVFHFVYAEQLVPFVNFISPKNKVVCTLHQPFDVLKKLNFDKKIKVCKKVILVGNSEIQSFKDDFGSEKITYVPHGIDTSFYHIDESVKKQKMLLTVGSWLRDYSFADKVYQLLLQSDPDLKIKVVADEKKLAKITPNERISLLSGISDENLKLLYLQSSVLFLPLIRYTANNSLLEAGACGCNIVIASNFADNSYIPETLVNLTEINVEETVKTIVEAMNFTYNKKLAQYVENHYSWNVVGTQTEKILREI